MNKWLADAGPYRALLVVAATMASAAFLALLVVVVGWPWFKAQRHIPHPSNESPSISNKTRCLFCAAPPIRAFSFRSITASQIKKPSQRSRPGAHA